MLINVLKETPIWVWIVFVYLIITGIKATQERTVHLSRFFIIPILLLSFKYPLFYNVYGIHLIFFIVLFSAFFYFFIPEKQSIKIHKNYVKLKGSYFPLALYMSFFAAKYVLGYHIKIYPHHFSYRYIDIILSALLCGFFLGRAFQFYKKSSEGR